MKDDNFMKGVDKAKEDYSVTLDKKTLEVVETFADKVEKVTTELKDLLIAKNAAYGNSALDPVRIFSKATSEEQILVRIDDKLSRLQRGKEFGNEDTIKDLLGYLVLLLLAREDK